MKTHEEGDYLVENSNICAEQKPPQPQQFNLNPDGQPKPQGGVNDSLGTKPTQDAPAGDAQNQNFNLQQNIQNLYGLNGLNSLGLAGQQIIGNLNGLNSFGNMG